MTPSVFHSFQLYWVCIRGAEIIGKLLIYVIAWVNCLFDWSFVNYSLQEKVWQNLYKFSSLLLNFISYFIVVEELVLDKILLFDYAFWVVNMYWIFFYVHKTCILLCYLYVFLQEKGCDFKMWWVLMYKFVSAENYYTRIISIIANYVTF